MGDDMILDLLRRLAGRTPIVVTAEASYIPVDPPPPRVEPRRHTPGPLWRCLMCLHWCADRFCCHCGDGRRP